MAEPHPQKHTHLDHVTALLAQDDGVELGGVQTINFAGVGVAPVLTGRVLTVTFTPKLVTGDVVGPASYVSGGFVVDLSASFTSLQFVVLTVTTVGPNLPPVLYEYTLNAPSAGRVTVKVMRHRYDRATVGNVSGEPAGVTVPTVSGGLVVAAGGHTHLSGGGHNGHAAVSVTGNASAVDAGGSGTAQNTVHEHAGAAGAHTHDAITDHQHAANLLYQHQHAATQTVTDVASVELAAGVDLSGSTWRYLAVGV